MSTTPLDDSPDNLPVITPDPPNPPDSAPPPIAKVPSELDRLKELWKQMDESAQDIWREKFAAKLKPAVLLEQIFDSLNVLLDNDVQLKRFRRWVDDQDKRQEQALRMRENEERLRAEHPDWTLDRVREEVLRQTYFEALSGGDYRLGLAAMTLDYRGRNVAINFRRLRVLERKAAQATEAEKVHRSKLTPEQKEAAYGRIFGTP